MLQALGPESAVPEAGQVNLEQKWDLSCQSGGAHPVFIAEKSLKSLRVAMPLCCEEGLGSPVRPRPSPPPRQPPGDSREVEGGS